MYSHTRRKEQFVLLVIRNGVSYLAGSDPRPRNFDDKYLFCLAISFLFRIYCEIKGLYKCYHCHVFMIPYPLPATTAIFPLVTLFLVIFRIYVPQILGRSAGGGDPLLSRSY